MSDEPQAPEQQPTELPYDKQRCKNWSRRIAECGLQSEWTRFKARHYRSADSKPECIRCFQRCQMLFVDRLDQVMQQVLQERATPKGKRRQELINLLGLVEKLQSPDDHAWAAGNLYTPVRDIDPKTIPSRIALNTLINAAEDATMRRTLLNAKKDADAEEPEGKELVMTDHDRKLSELCGEFEGGMAQAGAKGNKR